VSNTNSSRTSNEESIVNSGESNVTTGSSAGAASDSTQIFHEPPTHTDRSDPPIVTVQGGLVVPLYVIILSVIGGAINMTRKVPGFQKEGEDSDFSQLGPMSWNG
jgi:hypothetical protein